MITQIYDFLISLQVGLGNNVIPQLRAVIVEINEARHAMTPHFFYNCEITDELIEQCWDILEEVDGVGEYYCAPEQLLQLEYPKKLPIRGKLAYLRYESILPELKKENRSFLLEADFQPQAIYRLDMQEALLGKVTPALRHVSVDANPDLKKLIAHFIYDGEISELDHKLATLAIEESRISLPDYEMDSLIERVDFSNEMKHRGKWLAYWRHECKYTADGPIPDLRN